MANKFANGIVRVFIIFAFLLSLCGPSPAQVRIEQGDPPNPADIPDFFVSTLSDLEKQVAGVRLGKVEIMFPPPFLTESNSAKTLIPGPIIIRPWQQGTLITMRTGQSVPGRWYCSWARFTGRRWRGPSAC